MTKFEYINSNLARIRSEVRMGLIPVGTIKHYEVYSRYDYYLKQGYDKCRAVNFAGDDLRICDRQVYRIVNLMETEV